MTWFIFFMLVGVMVVGFLLDLASNKISELEMEHARAKRNER